MSATGYEEPDLSYAAPGEAENEDDEFEEAEDNAEEMTEGTTVYFVYGSVAEPEPVERQLYARAGAQVFWPGSGSSM
jgi:hypothetical protein